jgi:hypothetical protein
VFHDHDAGGRVRQHPVQLAPADPFNPDPTSVTTSATVNLNTVAPRTTQATCRTRSGLWPAEETPQHATTRPAATGSGSATSHVPGSVWTTGDRGIRPPYAHNQAVW